MWQEIKNFLIQIITALAAFWAGEQRAKMEQIENENKIKTDQIAIATRPSLSSDALLERMCREAGVPVSAISDPESADNRGIEDPR